MNKNDTDGWYAFDLIVDPALHKRLVLEPVATEIRVDSKSTLRCILQRKKIRYTGYVVPAIEYDGSRIICWLHGDEDVFVYDGEKLVWEDSNYPLPKKIAQDYGVARP